MSQMPSKPWAWWNRLVLWGGLVFGVYLLISGDTVERGLGIGLVAIPLLLYGWGTWRVLQKRRKRDPSKQDAHVDS